MFVIFWRLRLNVPRNASVTAHAFVRRRRRKASHASKVARQPVLSYHPREQRATRGTLRSRAIALISIARYRVDFNRAVIFEVNEYDRHGFQWVCRFIRIRASALSRARLFRSWRCRRWPPSRTRPSRRDHEPDCGRNRAAVTRSSAACASLHAVLCAQDHPEFVGAEAGRIDPFDF
jgi:hypothetical protein